MNQLPYQFGRYVLTEILGQGGFATVYRARDTKLKRQVAIKILHQNLSIDTEMVERFRREAEAASQLDHPNIIVIHDWGEYNKRFYIVMRLLPGVSLEQHLRAHGVVSIQQALPILRQIASALDYAHQRGIVHRDIKPANAIIAKTGRVVLTDFGLAKALQTQGYTLTAQGQIMGTPEYMAPEQADSQRRDLIGPATDVYALGVATYRMLTGRVPFPGHDLTVLYDHIHKPPPDPCSLQPSLPRPIGKIILRALAKEPSARYSTAGVFVEVLDAVSTVDPLARSSSQSGPTKKVNFPAGTSSSVTNTQSTLSSGQLKSNKGSNNIARITFIILSASMLFIFGFMTAYNTLDVTNVTPSHLGEGSKLTWIDMTADSYQVTENLQVAQRRLGLDRRDDSFFSEEELAALFDNRINAANNAGELARVDWLRKLAGNLGITPQPLPSEADSSRD